MNESLICIEEYLKKKKHLLSLENVFRCDDVEWRRIEKYDELKIQLEEMKNKIQNDNTLILQYWLAILKDYKYYPRYKFINSLESKARQVCGDNDESLSDHLESKRPYGNKNIPASILHSLGIDRYDVLSIVDIIPRKIEDWCMELHEDVVEYVRVSNIV